VVDDTSCRRLTRTIGGRWGGREGVDVCVVYLVWASVEKWILDNSVRQDTYVQDKDDKCYVLYYLL